MVELRTRKKETRGDGENHPDKLGLREICVQVGLPSPMGQEWVQFRWAITPIQVLPIQIRQVASLLSHIHLYPPYHSNVHPPSVFLVGNSTIVAEYKAKSSLSISPCHDQELILYTAYTEYSIHPRFSGFSSFSPLGVDP